MKIISFILALILTSGCAAINSLPTPETMRERYAVAEVSYGLAISSIEDLIDAGVIVKGSPTAKDVGLSIISARSGLDTWNEAIVSGIDVSDAEVAAISAISTLRALITAIQKRSGNTQLTDLEPSYG